MAPKERNVDFHEADQRYAELRQQHDAGTLTDEEFDARLKDLMVKDEKGTWWSKSRNSGEWNRRTTSGGWVKDTPPDYDTGTAVDEEADARRLPRGVLVALGVVGLALLGLVGILVAATSDPKVPDVVGQTKSEAERSAKQKGYNIDFDSVRDVRVDSQPKGTIVDQDPEPGESAAQGSAISVVVSAGQPPHRGDILRDDFSNPSSGWVESEGGSYESWARDYSGGQYRLYLNPPPTKPLPSLRAGKAVENGIVEVDAALDSEDPGTEAYWGVICRAQDRSNYYVFRIGADRRPRIWRVEDGRYTNLFGAPSSSDAVYGGKEENHLRADCIGSKLTFYVNGQKVAEVEDQTFAKGLVGVEAENSDLKPIEVLFDDYLVSSP